MEIKEINKIIQSDDKDEKAKSVKCICINYGDFLADCEGFVQKRYHDFKCNPKHQFAYYYIDELQALGDIPPSLQNYIDYEAYPFS